METFKGESFHTSRWNYHVDLEGKRVGIIGTGATAVQAVPELSKIAGELFVFQRTPSSVDVRDQRATTDEERAQWANEKDWSKKRRDRLAMIDSGRVALQGNDAFLSGKEKDYKVRKTHTGTLSAEERIQAQLNTNFRIMEQIRARVDSVVDDPATAESLKAFYPYGCKRPTFHDEFLPAFNKEHVHLVDCAPHGVKQINEVGVVHDGKEYPLDVLIYATGFEWMAKSTFASIVGRGGRSLNEKWDTEGVKTFLGIHSEGFPNLFILSGPQGGGGQFNFIRGIESHTDYVTWLLTKMRDNGQNLIDIKSDPENAYAKHCAEADLLTRPLRDCLSYYNGEGAAAPGSLAYYGGPKKWHELRSEAQETLAPYIFA